MKQILSTISLFIKEYFDEVEDFHYIGVGVLSIFMVFLVIPLMGFLSKYSMNVDYAIWSTVGQTSMYFAKIRFPEFFGKKTPLKPGTMILYYVIDCFLASLIGMFCTETIAISFFKASDPLYLAIASVCTGAFYETILKKVLRKNKEYQQDKK